METLPVMVKQGEFLYVYGDIPSDGQILFWSILLLDLYSGLREEGFYLSIYPKVIHLGNTSPMEAQPEHTY